MTELNAFFTHDIPGERVIGTYIYPYCLLSEPDWDNPLSATEIIQRIPIGDEEILVTRNGGLFIKPPQYLVKLHDPDEHPGGNFAAKQAFEAHAARLFNLAICEYALHEVISEPATPVHISAGKLIDDHALVTSAAGGREIYLERTINPSMHLLQHTWKMHRVYDSKITQIAAALSCASKLGDVSENLPSLTAGAYSLFSRHQLSEALIDAWIVIEQIVDWLWGEHRAQVANPDRANRLADSRTYTAAVRIEILHTIQVIDSDLYEGLTRARIHRNNLAHRAKISLDMASETLMAMKYAIECLCGAPIGNPSVSSGINW